MTARARATDPATSHAAAAVMVGRALSKSQAAVMDAMYSLGGVVIAWDVVVLLGEVNAGAITPRFPELALRGYLRLTGRERPGRTSSMCQEWAVVPPDERPAAAAEYHKHVEDRRATRPKGAGKLSRPGGLHVRDDASSAETAVAVGAPPVPDNTARSQGPMPDLQFMFT